MTKLSVALAAFLLANFGVSVEAHPPLKNLKGERVAKRDGAPSQHTFLKGDDYYNKHLSIKGDFTGNGIEDEAYFRHSPYFYYVEDEEGNHHDYTGEGKLLYGYDLVVGYTIHDPKDPPLPRFRKAKTKVLFSTSTLSNYGIFHKSPQFYKSLCARGVGPRCGPDDPKRLNLKTDAIEVQFFEKTAFLYYWHDGQFKLWRTAD